MDKKDILKKLANKEITPDQAKHLYEVTLNLQASPAVSKYKESIAVVGISLQLPGAKNIDEYWNNLISGVNSITEMPKERWSYSGFDSVQSDSSENINNKPGGFLKNLDGFDAEFFRISAYDACFIDPQQRIFLEECYRALEQAGYTQSALNGLRCGVYAGINEGDYREIIKAHNLDKLAGCSLGVPANFAAARIAYFLNLKGPAISLDTACSSSLVAIHLACQGILQGDCDIALAGGVFTMNAPDTYIKVANLGILSKEGMCRAFDRHADGTVISEGAAVLVLKPLQKALADHNHIYGIIRASAINQDGKTNGIAAPNGESQIELIKQLYHKHSIDITSIGYIEAHGTGTQLGDVIELKALSECFKAAGMSENMCAIGASKANIGHTSAAAGVAGLIKALLAVYYSKIPPQINFMQLNSNVSFKGTPFYINTELMRWSASSGIKRAAVSSFSIIGTNAHAVIEEAPKIKLIPANYKFSFYIFTFSAVNDFSLMQKLDDLAQWLNNHDNYDIADIAYTLSVCRTHFKKRISIVTDSVSHLYQALCLSKNSFTKEIINTYICEEKNLSPHKEKGRDANQLIDAILANNFSRDEFTQFSLLADQYVSGQNIVWTKLYDISHHRIVPLPAYPFYHKRYWITDLIKLSSDDLSTNIEKIFASFLGKDANELDKDATFDLLGIDSILLIQIINCIKEQLKVSLDVNDLIIAQTIRQLINHINDYPQDKISQAKQVRVNNNQNFTKINKKEESQANYLKLIKNCEIRNITLEENNQIETLIVGQGSPLLFLPPVDCLSIVWFQQINYFSQYYQVISPHYPGYGNSNFNNNASIKDISNMINQMLEKFNIDQPLNLVGWSLGGLIAQTFALQYPHKIHKLCLINTTSRLEIDNTTENIEYLISRLRHDLLQARTKCKALPMDENLIDLIKATKSSFVFMHYAREIIEFDLRSELDKIFVPTLIIAGGNDNMTPAVYSELLHSRLVNSHYILHPTAGHYIPLAEPEFFNEHLEGFLDDRNN